MRSIKMQRGKKEIKKILGNNDENKTREEKKKYQITIGETKIERKRENKKGPRNEIEKKKCRRNFVEWCRKSGSIKKWGMRYGESQSS